MRQKSLTALAVLALTPLLAAAKVVVIYSECSKGTYVFTAFQETQLQTPLITGTHSLAMDSKVIAFDPMKDGRPIEDAQEVAAFKKHIAQVTNLTDAQVSDAILLFSEMEQVSVPLPAAVKASIEAGGMDPSQFSSARAYSPKLDADDEEAVALTTCSISLPSSTKNVLLTLGGRMTVERTATIVLTTNAPGTTTQTVFSGNLSEGQETVPFSVQGLPSGWYTAKIKVGACTRVVNLQVQ